MKLLLLRWPLAAVASIAACSAGAALDVAGLDRAADYDGYVGVETST